MRAILSFFGSRWFLSFIGVALLAVLLWWFGPFLAFLDSPIVRGAIILVMLLIWAGVNLWLDMRRRKTEKTLVEGVTGKEPDAEAVATDEELAAMAEAFTGAQAWLKQEYGNRVSLYEQPWYAFIGPPGSGKTVALRNAGLRFLDRQDLQRGTRGTHMVDWWFTEDAVLLDTAGRYTTQEGGGRDKAGWEKFLNLLRRTRARQPLNGVIVAFAVQDNRQPDVSVGGAAPEQLAVHAAAIRRRIEELYEHLGVRLPVYMLFTKADLIAGFTDYFEGQDQAQVWGTTFPAAGPQGGLIQAFRTEFALLVQRLNDRLFDRLQNENRTDRRVLIAGFPDEVAGLQGAMGDFLEQAFAPARRGGFTPNLRGVYLTSGTQEGTPIDRLTATLAGRFGIDLRRTTSMQPKTGRSYFLSRLLKEVVLGEAMLVARDPAAVKRGWLLRIGVAAIAVLVVLLGAGALIQTRMVNDAAVARSNAAVAAYVAATQKQPLDPVRDGDLARILPLLDQARALPFGPEDQDHPTQWFPGLSQTGKLEAGSRQVYRNALQHILFPALLVRLEGQMQQNFNQPAFLYDATRIYLMLGSLGPLDAASIREWMHADWAATWSGPAAQPLRERLAVHLDALLNAGLPQIELNGALIEDARRSFSRISLADRVYAAIRRSPQAAALKPWRPGEAAGASGVRMFHRRSGAPMTDGILGFYTVDGFYKVLLPQLPAATRQAASESWVLGRQSEVDPNSPQAMNLMHDVIALYTADYEKQWDAMLGDLEIEPLGNLQQAVQSLYILSAPQSPMRDLLTGVTRQLTLTQPPADLAAAKTAAGAAGAAAAAANAAAGAVANGASRFQSLFAGQAQQQSDPPGKAVEDRYQPLITYVGKGPGAPIDNALKLLSDMQQQLAQLANAPPGGAAPPISGADPAQLVQAAATQAPQPVQRWLQALASGSNVLRTGGAKKGAAEAFNAPGGPASLCRQAVNGRYPFVAGASSDIPLDDFSRLFAPNGLLDQFFNTQIRPFVDTSGAVWKAQAVAGVAPPVSPGDLAQFQRAAAIRDLFFSGGNQPTVRFDILPVSSDNTTKQATLDLDGLTVVYAHGPQRPTSVTWPGTNRMNNVRLTFDPPPSSGPPVLQASGPWALFHLIDQGSLQRTGSADRYSLTFNLGDRQVTYEIRAGSVLNPFTPGVLRDFRCPSLP